MKVYDIYGFETDDMESISSLIEKTLGIKFEERDSYYYGGIYYNCGDDPEEENFSIQHNYNAFDEEWEEEDYTHLKTLLHVNNTETGDQIERILKNAIPAIVLIERKEISDISNESELNYLEAAV